jgi:hypothetical protein
MQKYVKVYNVLGSKCTKRTSHRIHPLSQELILMKRNAILPRTLSILALAFAFAVTGCTSQSSDDSDKSSRPEKVSASPTAEQGTVDTLRVGLNLDLSTGPWTTMVNDDAYAQVVYDDQPDDSTDCTQVACPMLLIYNVDHLEYKTRVVGDEMATTNECEGGVSAFLPPVFVRTVRIAGTTARYYESGPCPAANPNWTRRTWLLPGKMLIDERPGANGQLDREAFDKALAGAVKTD